ncbi:MAG: DUF4411 family protein [Synechococcus sp. SB0669_bin_7]|nr:DUF4411 family protein [Cyanobacteria bacterium MAG IRC3_bin_20]MDE0646848.1 DUF4411 family protein [Cyanobacteria bacterium MAG IRC4_bin_6]MYG64787.1 DUF4411 family protein [Synechococcus sp. SB0675_bin_7]MYK85436.1 DUF4411 family protein [Synechococcus sp. SB0669_bin_7]
MTKYLLDTNVFIQASNREYGFDVCPGFWDWLIEKNQSGLVASIRKVAEEIKKDEPLVAWVKERGNAFFLEEDDAMMDKLTVVSHWATSKGYKNEALQKFFGGADYYLIAYALAHDYIVVTHEVYSRNNKSIKIPNVCEGLRLCCINPYKMLRQEKVRLILDRTSLL